MGSELSGLFDRVTRLLDAAGIPFMVAGSFASTAARRLGVRGLARGHDRGEARVVEAVGGLVASAGDALDRIYIEQWVRDLDLDDEWKVAQTTPV